MENTVYLCAQEEITSQYFLQSVKKEKNISGLAVFTFYMGENKNRIKQLNCIVFYKVKNNTVAAGDGAERRKENTKYGKREKGL